MKLILAIYIMFNVYQLQASGIHVPSAEAPDVVLLASGSEVATLVDGARLLSAEGINARVVSVPSEGLFLDQSADYKESVIPKGIVRYGLTSGLPITLQGLVGENGKIHGLNHFGYSAAATKLDNEFGFNGEFVCSDVKELLAGM